MKKRILYFVLLLFPVLLMGQQQVAVNEIMTAATNYMSAHNSYRSTYNVSDISSLSSMTGVSRLPVIYEIIYNDGNAVLLSGSKACIPVLGYYILPPGGSALDNDNVPPAFKELLEAMALDIDSCLMSSNITLHYEEEWNDLLSPSYIQNRSIAAEYGPLLTSNWNQNFSNDGGDLHAYNYYVTQSGSSCNGYCAAGCVAVAMAQILYYWKHPLNRGIYTYYDWCNMPDELNFYGNPRYEIERNAVAKLIYDCGISVGMDYCSDGCSSSASLKDIVNPLKNSYGFSNSIDFQRKNWHSDNTWTGRVKENIENGWPVLYRGEDEGGHAFVCDGYRDSDKKFHFNWGWGGSYDGWFTLNSITPGSSNFTKRQRAIFYAYPDNSFVNFCNSTVNLYNIYNVYNAHGGRDFWNIVPHTGRFLESCAGEAPEAWRKIPSGETSQYMAFEEIVLRSGFTAEHGSNFTASIRECPNCNDRAYIQTREAIENNFIPREDIIDIENEDLIFINEVIENDFAIFPNPNEGLFSVTTFEDNLPYDLIVRNSLGQVVYERKNISSAVHHINLQDNHGGYHILEISSKDKKIVKKIIIL